MVSSLFKVYVLFRLLADFHFHDLHRALLGYRIDIQTIHLTEFLRLAAGKSMEWQQPFWMMTLDVQAAFRQHGRQDMVLGHGLGARAVRGRAPSYARGRWWATRYT